MTSPLKIASAIQNAQKSTGPRTEEGKRRSRMNALKHGLTAKTVLLPEEDPAEFQQLMVGWFDSIKPQDQCEASLVETGVYSLWQLGRSNRSQSARLWLKAFNHGDDQENRVDQEVAALVRRLLLAPNGRPAAFPCHRGPGEEPAGGSTWVGTIDEADHPAEVISRLVKSGLGCGWLLELWSELQASLEKEGWRAPERFRAFRLLGIHPSDAYMTTELASILQACQALDPDAGSLAGEVWNEFVPADALPALEAMYQREIAHMPAPDQDAARQYLLEIIKRETTLLEEKAQRHEERAEVEEELTPHRMAFDDSREGKLMRRYEDSCRKFFLRCLDELHRHRAEKTLRSKQGLGAGYYLPSPAWFEPLGAGSTHGAASAEAQTSNLIKGGQDCASAGLTSDGDGQGEGELRREPSGDGGTDSHNTNNGCVALESANVAAVERVVEEQRPRVVMDGARVERGHATNKMTGSNKERRKRRREERMKRAELSVVSGPLSVG